MVPCQPTTAKLCCAGIYNCGETIIREEGTRALWKGLTPFATHLTLKYALRMGSNSVFQSALRDKDGAQSFACFFYLAWFAVFCIRLFSGIKALPDRVFQCRFHKAVCQLSTQAVDARLFCTPGLCLI
jgi:hypothetical protein